MNIVILIYIIAMVSLYLIISVKYKRYRKIKLKKDLSGFDVARAILDSYDLNNVYITESKEILYSNYDHKRKTVRLVKGLFNGKSLTACAVSAMNAVYAILDKKKNQLFIFKKDIEQFISLLIYIGYVIIIIGSIFGHVNTIWVGFGIEMLITFFYLVTISTEIEAKNMALKELIDNKIINAKEIKRIKELLTITSLIGVASVISPFAEIIKKAYEYGKSD